MIWNALIEILATPAMNHFSRQSSARGITSLSLKAEGCALQGAAAERTDGKLEPYTMCGSGRGVLWTVCGAYAWWVWVRGCEVRRRGCVGMPAGVGMGPFIAFTTPERRHNSARAWRGHDGASPASAGAH
eukprot:scaffold2795_cov106-Isochrysis_galbana.AAC.2